MPAERPAFNIREELANHDTSAKEKLTWTGPFTEYLEKITENPRLVRNAHKRVYDSMDANPDIFTQGPYALYGKEDTLSTLKTVLKDGARGGGSRNKIIVVLGGVGSGKSTTMDGTKLSMERFSKTDEGAMYAIKSCPIGESPLNLIDKDAITTDGKNIRTIFKDNLGINIEGDLCVQCRHDYGHKSMHDLLSDDPDRTVMVRRRVISERDREGIGTFRPSDARTQSVDELLGSVNLSKLAEYGVASDPRAYSWDGELLVANGGIFEALEMFKAGEEIMKVYSEVASSKQIKVPRFANFYFDAVLLGHANYEEYKSYMSKPDHQAMKDRVTVIDDKYNLKVSNEVQIYDKLLRQSEAVRGTHVHINPHTIDISAKFAVLSRLKEPKKGISRIKKMHIYDGQEVEGAGQRDLKELREEYPEEGITGVSPRYVTDSLTKKVNEDGRTCLTPIDALRALRENLNSHAHTREMSDAEKKEILGNIDLIKAEYDKVATKEVLSAFVYAFDDTARSLAGNYVDNMMAYIKKTKIVNPITERETAPNEALLRSIELQIGVTEGGKDEFRRQIMYSIASEYRDGRDFDYTKYPRLKDAIQNKLLESMKDIVKFTTTAEVPDENQQRKLSEVQRKLMEEKDYCGNCSSELIEYAGNLLAEEPKTK